MENNDINILRQKIDEIDTQLLELINNRMSNAIKIGEIKKALNLPVQQSNREEEILKRLTDINKGPLEDAQIKEIFNLLFTISKALQKTAITSK